jgi:hypothetical protein
MWLYGIAHLLWRSLALIVAAKSSSFSAIGLSVLAFASREAFALYRSNWDWNTMRAELRQNIRDGLLVVACVWVVIFAFSVVITVYTDHQDLVRANERLREEKAVLTSRLNNSPVFVECLQRGKTFETTLGEQLTIIHLGDRTAGIMHSPASGTSFTWPNKSSEFYKCRFTNYTDKPILTGSITLPKILIEDANGSASGPIVGQYSPTVTLADISANGNRTLYITNGSKQGTWAFVTLPKEIKSGDQVWKTIISAENRSPGKYDGVIFFSPFRN